jgi:DNA-binding MurR/RpiR family transcriptional regulator
LTSPIPKEDLLTQVFATDIHNIERTTALTASDHLQAAADKIRRARQTLLVGGGATMAAVGFFAHALQVIL